ncbi:transporter substrate-binding domain-containing protein [Lutispora thermophila]|uniref:Amino acid ABC transporter substrate-binding protein, PAAT family (TC 3.A.1.3.-) n=1 Tax=Lutispora thermophila DSM 19022 TaxID=1122184 RepID=A0A1M6DV44_9FIRM|nr:transporter substrate-binding domain-containing protein [Lutispora thermophila]SHI77101.1 amino acid ABC transporter substrate-binding protein, PAAT family (TC 3.A.1.3.-) [Lutispora thermophila DSM 19022]
MKKVIAIFLCAVIISSVLTGCGKTGEKGTISQSSNEDKTIIVATSGDYLGFTVYDESTKTWSGFEIDMWNEIAKRIGYNVKFVQEDVATAFGDLETGRVDTVAKQISITPARKEKYDFTDPYFFSPYCLMVRGDNNEITCWDDMEGKTIGLADGSAMNEFVAALDPDNKVKKTTYESFASIPQEIVLGRVDAMPYAYLLIPYLLEKNPDWDLKAVDTEHPIYTEVNGYPFARTERGAELLKLVNGALNEMIKDGTHKKLSEKWFDYDVMETDAAKEYFSKNK